MKALDLLRSLPETDIANVGVVGVSWGGAMTTMVCGLAGDKVKAGFAIWGCGFFDVGNWRGGKPNPNAKPGALSANMTPEERDRWLRDLDPGRRVPNMKAAFFLAGAAEAQTGAPATRTLRGGVETTALRFGKLWDGSKITSDAVVVVHGDRIVSVGTGSASVPAGAQVIDLRKYTGIPGLIDLHTHITYYWDRKPGTLPRGTQRLPAVTVYLAQDNARRAPETGVTTIRDLNAGNDMDLAMRELIASGAMVGPRMFVSGPGLSSRPNQPLTPETVNSLVAARVKSGVDWIKVFGSRGSYDSVVRAGIVTLGLGDDRKFVGPIAHAAQGAGGVLSR
jgi:hypothetical protein